MRDMDEEIRIKGLDWENRISDYGKIAFILGKTQVPISRSC
jgi:hypothetical protein